MSRVFCWKGQIGVDHPPVRGIIKVEFVVDDLIGRNMVGGQRKRSLLVTDSPIS